jgi:hypothetical protein
MVGAEFLYYSEAVLTTSTFFSLHFTTFENDSSRIGPEMAEIGLAASVIAVIQITTAVVTQAYKYGHSVKNAKEDLVLVDRELKDLNVILAKLEDLAQRAEKSGQSLEKWQSLTSLNKKDGPLENCKIALNELETQLTPATGTTAKIAERAKWAWKKDKVKKTLNAILKQKEFFIESLNVDQA